MDSERYSTDNTNRQTHRKTLEDSQADGTDRRTDRRTHRQCDAHSCRDTETVRHVSGYRRQRQPHSKAAYTAKQTGRNRMEGEGEVKSQSRIVVVTVATVVTVINV